MRPVDEELDELPVDEPEFEVSLFFSPRPPLELELLGRMMALGNRSDWNGRREMMRGLAGKPRVKAETLMAFNKRRSVRMDGKSKERL